MRFVSRRLDLYWLVIYFSLEYHILHIFNVLWVHKLHKKCFTKIFLAKICRFTKIYFRDLYRFTKIFFAKICRFTKIFVAQSVVINVILSLVLLRI